MSIIASLGAPRTMSTKVVAVVAAALFTIMLVGQLYSYEDFASILSVLTDSNDASFHALLAALLVIAELFSLPYLLGMYISPLMRGMSALLSFVVAGFWLITSLTSAHSQNAGYFSSSFEFPGGLAAAAIGLALFALVCKVIYDDTRFRHDTLLR